MEKPIPPCLTDYQQGDKSCDGVPESKTDLDRQPCGWRLRCIALRRHLQVTGEKIGDHLTIEKKGGGKFKATAVRGSDSFARLCKSLVAQYGVADEFKPEAVPRASKSKETERKKGAAPLSTRRFRGPYRDAVERRRIKLMDVFGCFLDELSSQVEPWRIPRPGHAEVIGQIYIADRQKSGYLSIYCRTRSNRDIPIACVILKPLKLRVDIRLPVSEKAFRSVLNESHSKKIKIKKARYGRFRIVARGLDKGSVVIVAGALGKLIKRQTIELPAER